MDLYGQKEKLLDNIAYNIFLHRGIYSPCQKLLRDEIARLERVIADLYLKCEYDVEYNSFAVEFLTNNTNEIIFTSKYSGDVYIPDDYTELNVNTLIGTMERRKEREAKS